MAWEGIIDMMKEWVIANFFTQTQLHTFAIPLVIAGDPVPDCTGQYYAVGLYNGRPYYRREDSAYFIWWDAPCEDYNISTGLGVKAPGFFWGPWKNIEGAYGWADAYRGAAFVSEGYNYLSHGFVDRGDPAAADGSAATLTKDSAWHDWDLSGVVPHGAQSILLRTQLQANAVDKFAMFRKKGHVNAFNRSQIRSTTANVWLMQDLVVAVDANRKIQYNVSIAGITGLWISIAGWWF